MRKAIYPLVFASSMALISCSSIMNNLPGVYTIDVQQGNIVNQDMIDQLRPQMTKRQVLYIMGSSMLVDVFHQKRWDYLYSVQPGGEHRRQKRLSLFFDGDKLIGVQGDFRPSTLAVIRQSNETTVDVPKRNYDKTLWGNIKTLINDDAPIKPQDDIKKEESTDIQPESKTETENNATETTEDLKKVDENEGIELTPLEEEIPQKLEDITDVQKAIVTQSESKNENTEISKKVSENDESIKTSPTDTNQEDLKEVTDNEQHIDAETDQELIENEKILQEEDVSHKIEEISVDKKSAITEIEPNNDAPKTPIEENNQKELEEVTSNEQTIDMQTEVDTEKTESAE